MAFIRRFAKTTSHAVLLLGLAVNGAHSAPTPARALLVLEKDTRQLDIIDPGSLTVVAKVPVGPDPHEVVASTDGKTAYVSNFRNSKEDHHVLTVIDLIAQKPLAPIELGPLIAPHGLWFSGGKLYFTAQVAKAIGRYDPATRMVDWVMGVGQDRTHMIWVDKSQKKIVATNVDSNTVSIIEASKPPGPAGIWDVKNIPVGRASEGFAVSPDGSQIWAASPVDNNVTVIDFAAEKAIATIPISVRGANRAAFTPDGKYFLVSGLAEAPPGTAVGPPNAIVIDVATRKEMKQLNLGGGAAGILMDSVGGRAFVASNQGKKVVIIRLKDFSIAGTIGPLAQPDGMAWAVRQ